MKSVKIFIMLLLLCKPALLLAQTGLQFNSGNFHDPRIIFINPALSGLTQSRVVIGYETFYLGIGENLANKFVGWAQHNPKWGNWAITAQYFNSNIFNKSIFELSYNRSFWNKKITAGLKFGFLGVALNRDEFELDDPNDPLLESSLSKYQPTIGFGLLFKPVPQILIGIAAHNLNQPNLSLIGRDAKEPPSVNATIMYDHPLLKPFLCFEHEHYQTYFSLGLESWLLNQTAILKMNYASGGFGCGAAYRLKNLRLDYEYKYPLTELNEVTSGTHQFIVSYLFPKSEPAAPPGPDFALKVESVSPKSLSQKGIYPGQEAEYEIKILPLNAFNQIVEIQITDVPAGLHAHFRKRKIGVDTPTRLFIKTEPDCPAGEFPLHLLGQAGALQRLAEINLRIKLLPELKAAIACEPEILKITKIQEIHEESPLLNYIFFGKNSSVLSSERYEILNPAGIADGFVFFPDSVTDISVQYKNTLNLLAKRLLEHPATRIILVGCNCDFGKEKDNPSLSSARARMVKRYFVQNCNISENRIEIQSRNLPENYSSNSTEEGRAENRRVEIHVARGSENVLEPYPSVTSQIVTSDSLCRFSTAGSRAEIGIKSWTLKILNKAGDFQKVFSGNEHLPREILWDWRDNSRQHVIPYQTYQYQLSLFDPLNQKIETPVQTIQTAYEEITRQHISRKQKVEKTRLFLFKFDEDRINVASPRLKKRLDQLARKIKAASGAKVILKGFTDTIGSDKYNLELSQRRAQTILEELKQRHISGSQIETRGFGKKFPLMSNSLPEGRMMNRRVEVYIEHPE